MTTHPALAPDTFMLDAALQWAGDGVDVFPLWWPVGSSCACPGGDACENQGKHPMTAQGFKDATCDVEQITDWWNRWPKANIGIPTGRAFDVVDIDGGAAAWVELIAKHGTPKHIGVVMTGRDAGGFHFLCAPGGQKTIPSGKRGLPDKIEIKGVGGYVVGPPSLHASGRRYAFERSIEGTTYGDVDYGDWYAAVTASTEIFVAPTATVTAIYSDNSGSKYGAAVLTNACDMIANAGVGGRWNALALEAVPKAVRGVVGKCIDRTVAIDAIQRAAAAAGLSAHEVSRVPELFAQMEAQGVTHPIAPKDTTAAVGDWLRTLPASTLSAAYIDAAGQDVAREHSSWWPKDLKGIIAGDNPEPEPSFLQRADGQYLFYPGKVNGIIGESESGKTWIALLGVVQALTEGKNVLYLDFEDTAPGIISRLKAMSVTDSLMGELQYIGPDEGLHDVATRDLGETMATHCPDLVIIDGFNAAMSLMGLDINSNNDATAFSQQLLKPLSATGACVIYVDHLPKNRDARGKGGIGAQAKRAMTTGCAISVDVAQPFGRNMIGRLTLLVDKDRPGYVRAASILAKMAGEAVLTSSENGSVDVVIHPAIEPLSKVEVAEIKADDLEQTILTWLAGKELPVPKGAIRDGVGAGRDGVAKAIDDAVALGLIHKIHCFDGNYRYAIKPFDGTQWATKNDE